METIFKYNFKRLLASSCALIQFKEDSICKFYSPTTVSKIQAAAKASSDEQKRQEFNENFFTQMLKDFKSCDAIKQIDGFSCKYIQTCDEFYYTQLYYDDLIYSDFFIQSSDLVYINYINQKPFIIYTGFLNSKKNFVPYFDSKTKYAGESGHLEFFHKILSKNLEKSFIKTANEFSKNQLIQESKSIAFHGSEKNHFDPNYNEIGCLIQLEFSQKDQPTPDKIAIWLPTQLLSA